MPGDVFVEMQILAASAVSSLSFSSFVKNDHFVSNVRVREKISDATISKNESFLPYSPMFVQKEQFCILILITFVGRTSVLIFERLSCV